MSHTGQFFCAFHARRLWDDSEHGRCHASCANDEVTWEWRLRSDVLFPWNSNNAHTDLFRAYACWTHQIAAKRALIWWGKSSATSLSVFVGFNCDETAKQGRSPAMHRRFIHKTNDFSTAVLFSSKESKLHPLLYLEPPFDLLPKQFSSKHAFLDRKSL